MSSPELKSKKTALAIGTGWVVLLLFFGLLQLWLDWAWDYYKDPEHFGVFPAMSQGAILFFCSAATSAVSIDFHFEPAFQTTFRWWKGTCFILMPIIIVVVALAGYFITVKAHAELTERAGFSSTSVITHSKEVTAIPSPVIPRGQNSTLPEAVSNIVHTESKAKHERFMLHSNFALLFVTMIYALGCKAYMYYAKQ